jgi:hypothetical protein
LLGHVAMDGALALFTKMQVVFPFVRTFLTLCFPLLGTLLTKALADARSLALCSTSGKMPLIWRFLTWTG